MRLATDRINPRQTHGWRARTARMMMWSLIFALGLALAPQAAAQDMSTQTARAARAGAIVPLDGPVLAGKPVTFKLKGNPSNPHWNRGDEVRLK